MKINSLTRGCATVFLALALAPVRAQDRGHDQDHHGQDHQDSDSHVQNNHDQGHHDQDRQGHSKFDDHDRQVTRDWYNQQRGHKPAGFRDRDRLAGPDESRLQPGYVLDRDMRGRIHTLPSDYSRRLSSPSRGYRYVAIGDHVCLIDSSYRVKDVIHLEVNF